MHNPKQEKDFNTALKSHKWRKNHMPEPDMMGAEANETEATTDAKKSSTVPRGWNYAGQQAKPFQIHAHFPTEVEVLRLPADMPKVLLSQLALHKIFVIVGAIELEVGWLGIARREGKDFVIDDVFLFEQDVSFGHTELTTDSMSNIMQEVLKRPDGEHVFNNTRFWGHSHGSGGTDPSQQDNRTMSIFKNFGADFFIRGIFNRTGDINFSIYDFKRGMAFHRAPWKLEGKAPTKPAYEKMFYQLRQEMAEKVIHYTPAHAAIVYPAVSVGILSRFVGLKTRAGNGTHNIAKR
ncbi:MAG TPA: hypothetical protein VFT82_00405 [Candidatus Paceibacterota bacterium]|nr:hypothetical protein [Candidatus Paceibacterota bacterium]